jgi:hypothetical protein
VLRVLTGVASILFLAFSAMACGGGSSDGSSSAPAAQGGGTQAPQSSSEIGPGGFELVGASARVAGLGPSRAYVWGKEGEEDFVQVATFGALDNKGVSVLDQEDVSCTFLPGSDFVLQGTTIRLESGEDTFTASFFASQTESLSIGSNAEGLVTGGFSTGDGSRNNSQQWPIVGDGWSAFGASPIENVENDPFADPTAFDPRFDGFAISAEWSGESVENFSGEEAAGSITVSCFFAVPSD